MKCCRLGGERRPELEDLISLWSIVACGLVLSSEANSLLQKSFHFFSYSPFTILGQLLALGFNLNFVVRCLSSVTK